MEILGVILDLIMKLFTYHANIQGLMCADPATLALAAATLGSGMLQSNAAADSATTQANATAQGGKAQRQFASDTFNYDNQKNYDAGQWLFGKDGSGMPQFDMTQLTAPNGANYFSDKNVNGYYDQANSNLMGNANTAVNNAQQSFGASSASRGYANPSAGQAMVGNNAFQSFIPQLANLEQSRAGAMMDNKKNQYNADFQGAQFNSSQQQMLNALKQQNYGNKNQFAQTFGSPTQPFNKFAMSKPNYAAFPTLPDGWYNNFGG